MIYAEPQHPFIRKGSTESPQKQQRIVEPSTSLVSHKPIVVAENQHPFIRKGSIKFPQKQQRIVEFWARPSTSSVSQRLIGTTREVDIPQKSISGPSTPPDARDESPSPNREKSPAEAPRQRLMEFLQTCTPKMDIWYEPLVAFGCDNMPFLEALARWDDKSLEAGLRRVKDQPGIDKTLEGIDVVFLFRNLRKRFQTRG
jgi:hypothetical protein